MCLVARIINTDVENFEYMASSFGFFVRHINVIEVCHAVYLFERVRLLVMRHSYDYLSSGVSFFKIPQSFRDLT
jgi:hypothetical protein